MTSSVLELMRR